jgi:hypothetical protein
MSVDLSATIPNNVVAEYAHRVGEWLPNPADRTAVCALQTQAVRGIAGHEYLRFDA